MPLFPDYATDTNAPPIMETPGERVLKFITGALSRGQYPMRSRADVQRQYLGRLDEQAIANQKLAESTNATTEAKELARIGAPITHAAALGADYAAHPAKVQFDLDQQQRRQAAQPGIDYARLRAQYPQLADMPYDEGNALYKRAGGAGEMQYEEKTPFPTVQEFQRESGLGAGPREQMTDEAEYLNRLALQPKYKVPARIDPFANRRFSNSRGSISSLIYENTLRRTGDDQAAEQAVAKFEQMRHPVRAGLNNDEAYQWNKFTANLVRDRIRAIAVEKRELAKVTGLSSTMASRDARLRHLDEEESNLVKELATIKAANSQTTAAETDASKAGAAARQRYGAKPAPIDPNTNLEGNQVVKFNELLDDGVPVEEAVAQALKEKP